MKPGNGGARFTPRLPSLHLTKGKRLCPRVPRVGHAAEAGSVPRNRSRAPGVAPGVTILTGLPAAADS